MKRTAKTYQEKNAELEELYQHLRSRPETEAIEILRRLRGSADVSSVLRSIKDGDLMIQQSSRTNDVYDVYDVNITRSRSSLQVDLAMKYPNIYLLGSPTWLNQEDQKVSTTWSEGQQASESARISLDNEEKTLSRMEQSSNRHRPLTVDFARFPNEHLSKATCNP